MNARRDTVKDWVVQQYREIVGDCDTARAGKQVDSDAQPDTRRPLHPPTSPIAVTGAAAAVYAPRLLPAVDGNETATETDVLTQLHGSQWPLVL
ncbi:hypothetical protein HJ581_0048330 (plasmid) [Rhodococcus opacus]|nr:hypothetical protein HJ581_0048330 [Rhodococcus opacus]